jgi:dTDP-glucose pyrophosphorylase
MIDFSKHMISDSLTIKEALIKLNEIDSSLTLFVTEKYKYVVGTLTDGDVRRGLIKGLHLNDPVKKFMNTEFFSLPDDKICPSKIREIKMNGIKLLPVLDSKRRIKKVIDFTKVKTLLPLDAVLMAGGRGERLRPLTDTTPKPMLKIGEKPIIEHNIDHIRRYGITDFFLTVRYLSQIIEEYCGDGSSKDIIIQYVHENEPLGTMGSISLIRSFIHRDVLVMNADLFTNIDIEDFYLTYMDQKADMAIATVPYIVDVPYAVLELNKEQVEGFKEKPTYTYQSNAGIYLINRDLFKAIPVSKKFNATDFIQALIESGRKIIHYPIMGYWIDIGKSEDYQKVQEIVKHLHQ